LEYRDRCVVLKDPVVAAEAVLELVGAVVVELEVVVVEKKFVVELVLKKRSVDLGGYLRI